MATVFVSRSLLFVSRNAGIPLFFLFYYENVFSLLFLFSKSTVGLRSRSCITTVRPASSSGGVDGACWAEDVPFLSCVLVRAL